MTPTSVNEDTRQAALTQNEFSVFATTLDFVSVPGYPSAIQLYEFTHWLLRCRSVAATCAAFPSTKAARGCVPDVTFFNDSCDLSLSR